MRNLKEKVRSFMRLELVEGHPDIISRGEVNLTRLAENAAHAFNHDEWLDDETHWVWDVAVEEAESHQS